MKHYSFNMARMCIILVAKHMFRFKIVQKGEETIFTERHITINLHG